MEYDFLLLKEHYKKLRFVPRKRYTFMTPFRAFNYPEGFLSEHEFRREVFRVRPLFVANTPPDDEVVIDLDYRLKSLDDDSFERARDIASTVIEALKSVIDVREGFVRFSGRGIHAVAKTGVIERAIEIREELGINGVKDVRSLVNKYVFYGLMNTMEWKEIGEYVDKSNVAGNKIYRTPNSLNEKSMLPVVEFKLKERITFEKIINAVTRPRTFAVMFSRPVRVREGTEFSSTKFARVDEYEFLRLLLKNNYYIQNFRVV